MSRIQSYNQYIVLNQSAYSNQTMTNAAVVSLPTIPSNSGGLAEKANACTITVSCPSTTGDAIYYRLDGQDPTSSNGLALRDGAVLELFSDELANARFIGADGNIQTLRVEFAVVS